ncbi:MAG: Sua5/YciO/YrdC/YwlC family protein, partial [Acidimicrobiales bacterium]
VVVLPAEHAMKVIAPIRDATGALPDAFSVDLSLGEPATTIGLRVPDDVRLQAVAELVGPLAATSANRHGDAVAATAGEARAAFGDAVALVVDGGRLGERSSTVVDATSEPWRVVREGPIPAAAIFATGPGSAR